MRRLLRREGITVFVKAGPAKRMQNVHDETPVHTLVCCDDPMSLPQAPAGTVRLHPRDGGTEQRDTVTLFALHRQLVPGKAGRPSWDYKKARIDESTVGSSLDQGESGNDLARLLTDVAIDIPHAGDSWSDHERLTRARMLAHEFEAERYDGVSSVRDLAVGAWITLTGDPDWDVQLADKRQFVITSIDHDIWNNLPKGFNERVQALFAASRNLAQAAPALPAALAKDADTRYENAFGCVRRGVPLAPAYDPRTDLPPVHLLTGTIVGTEDDEVFCDEDGRVRVRIHGLDPADHAHAQGAGTNDNAGDSAPIRVATSLAGTNFGASFLPRVGMEVLLGCVGGDPDRLVIIGVLSNGAHPPATFSHTGRLPGNRYLSGIKTKEIKGQRYNQLRLDDTSNSRKDTLTIASRMRAPADNVITSRTPAGTPRRWRQQPANPHTSIADLPEGRPGFAYFRIPADPQLPPEAFAARNRDRPRAHSGFRRPNKRPFAEPAMTATRPSCWRRLRFACGESLIERYESRSTSDCDARQHRCQPNRDDCISLYVLCATSSTDIK